MLKGRLLTSLLISAFLAGCISPAGSVYAAEMGQTVQMEDCTEELKTEENEFLIDEDGVLIKYNGTGDSVVIPESVTCIGEYAFENCNNIKNITLPANLKKIEEGAFWNCSGLSSITIPKETTSIGEDAFFGCDELKTIQVEEDSKSFSAENGVLYDKSKHVLLWCANKTEGTVVLPTSLTGLRRRAFSGCRQLNEILVEAGNNYFTSENGILYNKDKSELYCVPAGKEGEIIISDSVTDIGMYACEFCKMEKIVLPDGLAKIEGRAFFGCDGLTSITIPKTVKKISYQVFSDCENLKEILVEEGNEAYTSENGMLYDSEKHFLLCCAGGKEGEAVISDSVTYADELAFYNCEKLTAITLSNEMTSIGYKMFEGCTNLKKIKIPKSVTSIDKSAFATLRDFEIICPKDSYAEQYAKENGIGYDYERKDQTITVSVNEIEKTFGDAAFSLNAATDGDGNLSYVSDNTAVAAADGNGMITITGAGTAHITITASKTDYYNAAEKIVTITVKQQESPNQPIPPSSDADNSTDSGNETGIGTENGTEAALPAVGTRLIYKNDIYRVTKQGKEVTFVKPKKKRASVTVCSVIKADNITYKVTSISANAFKNNKKLKRVVIGKNVKKIGKGAFRGCSKLSKITIKSKKLKSVGKNTFKGIKSNAKIKVPAKKAAAYKKLLKGKGQGKKVKIIKQK